MYSVKEISDKLYYIGVNDRRTELFENIFPLTSGISYNSYLLTDDKTVLFDTVDSSVHSQFMENLEFVLSGKNLDYLIVNHMEPDHASCIKDILLKFPNVTIVGNAKTFAMINQFFNITITNQLVVKEGDCLETGSHSLTFVMTPMVHWPEVMMTYDKTNKTVFSADSFGGFGALDGHLFADEYDFERDRLDEARRYYTNIVGKYGPQAVAAINKLANIEKQMICPLHGPIFRNEMIDYFTKKQLLWAKYEPEVEDGIYIAYASMYGNTESVVNALALKLSSLGKKLKVQNICNTDKSYLVSEAFKYGKLIFACPTYTNEIYPAMSSFLKSLKSLDLKNRTVFIIENGTWAPTAGKQMEEIFASMKNMEVVSKMTIKSALHDETTLNEFISNI